MSTHHSVDDDTDLIDATDFVEDHEVSIAGDPQESDAATTQMLEQPATGDVDDELHANDPAVATTYPTELHADESRPLLFVHEVSQNGVVLRFDCKWLEHAGFRASMPMVIRAKSSSIMKST